MYDEYNHFVCIVASENPEALMATYNKALKTDKYIKYKKEDAEKLKEINTQFLRTLVDNADENSKPLYENMLLECEEQDLEDFFYDLMLQSNGEFDEETGDIVSTENPNGKWASYQLGRAFSIPFYTLDGKEVFQARKKDIDWDKMHLFNQEPYKIAWETVMEGKEPETETEKTIYENMKNRVAYFKKFGSKENYIISCTAFWAYAFLSEATGWVELEDDMNQFDWMSGFYDKFIRPLPDDMLLTIYECRKF